MRSEEVFNTEGFRILDRSWDPIISIRRMIPTLNSQQDDGDRALFRVSRKMKVVPIVVDLSIGVIIFGVEEVADQGEEKSRHLDVFWI